MDQSLLGDLTSDPTLPQFAPSPQREDMEHVALACRCGGTSFRVTGWPRIATGRGGFFWRSVTRVFREARQPMVEEELAESPFWLPLTLTCRECERETRILDASGLEGNMPEDRRGEPCESLRCRVCRRGYFELVVGFSSDSESPGRFDLELVSRCRACHRVSRIAWSHGRPSAQEVSLDLLYGRR